MKFNELKEGKMYHILKCPLHINLLGRYENKLIDGKLFIGNGSGQWDLFDCSYNDLLEFRWSEVEEVKYVDLLTAMYKNYKVSVTDDFALSVLRRLGIVLKKDMVYDSYKLFEVLMCRCSSDGVASLLTKKTLIVNGK